jgi:hypothetical protein
MCHSKNKRKGLIPTIFLLGTFSICMIHQHQTQVRSFLNILPVINQTAKQNSVNDAEGFLVIQATDFSTIQPVCDACRQKSFVPNDSPQDDNRIIIPVIQDPATTQQITYLSEQQSYQILRNKFRDTLIERQTVK